MTTLRTEEEINKELDKTMLITKAGSWLESSDYDGTVEEIKDFIHSLREQDLQVIKEWVEENSYTAHPDKHEDREVVTLDDLTHFLNSQG